MRSFLKGVVDNNIMEPIRTLFGYATNSERALVVMSQLARHTDNMFDNQDIDGSLTRLNKPLSLSYSGKHPSEFINRELIQIIYGLEERGQIYRFCDCHPSKIPRSYLGLTSNGIETVKKSIEKKPFSNSKVRDLMAKVTEEVVKSRGERFYFGEARFSDLSGLVHF
jgi:hypothetical protein